MSVAAALARLRAVAVKFPEDERPTFAPPASADAVEMLARAVGAPLPSELRDFLANTEKVVAMDVWNGYWIGGPVTLARSLTRGDYYPNAVDLRAAGGATIPFAGDGGGNGFDVALTDGRVWHWNHETGFARAIAPSFSAFLERVVEDWEHAAAGDPAWRYLSGR